MENEIEERLQAGYRDSAWEQRHVPGAVARKLQECNNCGDSTRPFLADKQCDRGRHEGSRAERVELPRRT